MTTFQNTVGIPFNHKIQNETHSFMYFDFKTVTPDIVKFITPLTDKCFTTKSLFYPPSSNIFLLTHNQQPICVAAVTFSYTKFVPKQLWKPPTIYLYNVCTDPKFRGHHLQEVLLGMAFSDLKHTYQIPFNVYLIVNIHNHSADKLYSRLGFTKILTTSNDTPDGQPANLLYLRYN